MMWRSNDRGHLCAFLACRYVSGDLRHGGVLSIALHCSSAGAKAQDGVSKPILVSQDDDGPRFLGVLDQQASEH